MGLPTTNRRQSSARRPRGRLAPAAVSPVGTAGEATTIEPGPGPAPTPPLSVEQPAGPSRLGDHLGGFSGSIVALRWVTTTAGLALAGPEILEIGSAIQIASAAIALNTVYRSLTPIAYDGSPRSQLRLAGEVVVSWTAVLITGFWSSPLALTLVNALVIVGFALGFALAIRIGLAVAISLVALWSTAESWWPDGPANSIQWTAIMLLAGALAGSGRRVVGEVSQQHSEALDRLSRLTNANHLLYNLHTVAKTLPASLDRDEVLTSGLQRLRTLLRFDRAAILVHDESDRTWNVGQQQALGLGGSIAPTAIPEPGRRALAGRKAVLQRTLEPGSGFHKRSASGLYAPLTARNHLVGLVVVERDDPDGYDDDARQTLVRFCEPMALAMDNAQWFGRLRTMSADEERNRIARDLHDRIGQSVACLGFDVDRLLRRFHDGELVETDLQQVRSEVKAVTTELRDALYDLRTEVTETRDFENTMSEFAGRVSERSGVTIHLDCRADSRPPFVQEREMWRIAQEALINVERHAEAERVEVIWRSDHHGSRLEVTDDGRGMNLQQAGRADSYGIVGMRERAKSIGAALALTSTPGEGTTVRCQIDQS